MNALRPAATLLILFTILLGGVYPAAVWLLGQTLFNAQANGSLIYDQDQVTGSTLIGQSFTSDRYFWSRPSATHGGPYQFMASGASGLSPANTFFLETVKARAVHFRESALNNDLAPIDLLTASASGLDPDISHAAAIAQIERVAHARGMTRQALAALVDEHTQSRTFGFLGAPRVNVLRLNLALDHIAPRSP